MADTNRHPLAGGNFSVFNAWLGFFKMVAVCYALVVMLTDCANCVSDLSIAGVPIPLAIFVGPVAWIIYKHERYVSQTRPETVFFDFLDFATSLGGTVIVSAAALSWFPPAALLMSRFGLPLAPFNLMTFTIVFYFLPLSLWDLIVNQFWVARYGRHAIPGFMVDQTKLVITFNAQTLHDIGAACGTSVGEQLKPLLERIEILTAGKNPA